MYIALALVLPPSAAYLTIVWLQCRIVGTPFFPRRKRKDWLPGI